MFGVIKTEDAKRMGYTHHARWYGVPCWHDRRRGVTIAKWGLLEYWITACYLIDAAVKRLRNEEIVRTFTVLEPIA